MDNLQFMLQGERRHSNHPHTRNVHQREITPKSIHWGVVGPSPSLAFGNMPWNVVCTHEGSTDQLCEHRIDLWQLVAGGERLGKVTIIRNCRYQCPVLRGCKSCYHCNGTFLWASVIAPKTAIKEVHENAEQIMIAFDELKSNQFEDSKDGVVGNA